MNEKYLKYKSKYLQLSGANSNPEEIIAGLLSNDPNTIFDIYIHYFPMELANTEYFRFNQSLHSNPYAIDTIPKEAFSTYGEHPHWHKELSRADIRRTSIPYLILEFLREQGIITSICELESKYTVIITPCYYFTSDSDRDGNGQKKYKSFNFNTNNWHLFLTPNDFKMISDEFYINESEAIKKEHEDTRSNRIFTEDLGPETIQNWIGFNNSQSDNNRESIFIYLIKIPDNDNAPRPPVILDERKDAYINRFLTLFGEKYRIPRK
jgi:hypothetical protein